MASLPTLKRVFCEIRDTDTNEVLGSNRFEKTRGIADIGCLITKAHKWYYSFQRGFSTGRNLTLTIKIQDAEIADGLLDFE